MKLVAKRELKVEAGAPVGFTFCRFPYDEATINWLKSIPGPAASRDDGGWRWAVPDELISALAAKLDTNWAPSAYPPLQMNTPLRPYQNSAINMVLTTSRLLLSFEMRLGKSAVAIEAMRLTDAKNALIVAPASTRLVWQDELAKWWPDSPKVGIGWSAKDDFAEPIIITSYELLEEVIYLRQWGAIIIDESHNIGNASGNWRKKTKRAELVTTLLHSNPDALQLLMTGTPLTTENLGVLWHQLHALYPLRFGREYQFRMRYQNRVPDKWARSGFKFEGVNAEFADELQQRLSAVSMRVTRAEVAEYLPPSQVRLVKLRAKDQPRARKLGIYDQMRAHLNDASAFLLASGRAKIDAAVEHALEAGEAVTHAACIVYHHDLAQEICAALIAKGDREVVYVSGETDVRRRMVELQRAKDAPKAYIVGTMMSINTGLNLTWVKHATIAEIYTAPGPLAQICARFAAVNNEPSTPVDILVLEGTSDETEARRVTDRLDEMSTVYTRGGTESAIATALAPAEQSDAEFFAAMREIASRRVSE